MLTNTILNIENRYVNKFDEMREAYLCAGPTGVLCSTCAHMCNTCVDEIRHSELT